MRPVPKLFYISLWLLAVLCAVALASPRGLFAEATPPAPGVPILPAKPTATPTVTPMPPAFQIVNHYTAPQQTRGREPFDLHLEIKNVGNRPASGYTLRIKECTGDIQAEASSQLVKLGGHGRGVATERRGELGWGRATG